MLIPKRCRCRLSDALQPTGVDRFNLLNDQLTAAAMEGPTNEAGINLEVARMALKHPGEGLQASQPLPDALPYPNPRSQT